MDVPKGFCQCGCGGPTWIATTTNRRKGFVKGEPVKFIRGHGARTGATPRYVNRGREHEHVTLATRALGRRLPSGVEIHHVNENKRDNGRGNLVICQDRAYHQLLHRRRRALHECGHADWMRCGYCRRWDEPGRMYVRPGGRAAFHPGCSREYQQRRRA